MKKIKYRFLSCEINSDTEQQQFFLDKSLPYSEVHEEIAKKEAYNGEYTIEDDGLPEPEVRTDAERLTELEEALASLLEGAVE